MRQARPKNIWSFLEKKSNVLHFPVHVPRTRFDASPVLKTGKCRILWPHRWEHDKNPEEFFDVMVELSNAGVEFDLVILGQSYSELPENMPAYKDALQKHIMHMGFVNSKEEYWNWISSCDIVVSTAIHEFFGVAVIEAVALGCYPILPNRLAYPKLFPKDYLYSTKAQLVKKVRKICRENELLQIRSIASHTVLQNLVQNVLSWNMNGVYRDTILE
jgi:glycosyltransferase involved in cell wall biosynthesis